MAAPNVVEALRVSHGATAYALGVELPVEGLLDMMRAVRDRLGYRYYLMAVGIDRGASFEVVHAVRNLDLGDDLCVKVRVPRERPELPSLALLWAGAEWHEREILDLLGVTFHGHPDPRRILMPDDYPGHPLRRDFAMDTPWGYRPPTREGAP